MVNSVLELFRKARDPKYKQLGITETTAIAQAMEFFIASYEGVRTILTVLTYFLAIHPEIQEKLFAEIDPVIEKYKGGINAETVADLPYLTACLSETLRISPGFFRLDRKCTKDWEHNGIRIKKGMHVVIPLWALHRDPEQYPEPETFDPERFLPGRKEKIDAYVFNGFGQGPRSCIGQKFAYEMLKIVMIRYLKDFRIERRPDTVLKAHVGNPFFLFYDPILLNFVKRRH